MASALRGTRAEGLSQVGGHQSWAWRRLWSVDQERAGRTCWVKGTEGIKETREQAGVPELRNPSSGGSVWGLVEVGLERETEVHGEESGVQVEKFRF